MKGQIKIALWNKVKTTYPSGTSKHTNALLEEDFDSFIEDVVKICTMPAVVGRSELLCEYEPDNTTAMNCKHCGNPKWVHKCCSLA